MTTYTQFQLSVAYSAGEVLTAPEDWGSQDL